MRGMLVVAAVVCLLPLCAAAAGMKPGQWEITMTMDLGKDAPKMPQLSPDQLAQMKQMGISPPSLGIGGPRTFKSCVSPQDAESGKPPMDQRADRSCKQKDLKRDGNRMTMQIVCDGEMMGTGDIEVTNDSPEHYRSKFHFVGSSHGHAVDMTNSSEGRWLGAACK
jgi:hypothetical protein